MENNTKTTPVAISMVRTDSGFQMTFANGVTASVMFGPSHFCSNIEARADRVSAKDAEVAAFDRYTHEWLTQRIVPDAGDDVVGHMNADKVVEFLVKAAALAR
jgi:hypothetical protein